MRILYHADNHPRLKNNPSETDSCLYNIGNWQYSFPGYEASLRPGYTIKLSKETITESLARYIDREHSRQQKIYRDTIAHLVDWNLWILSRMENVLDLVSGEVLAELYPKGITNASNHRLGISTKDKKLEKLGYVKISDFCREELDISAGAGYELIRNATALKKYPLLREAYSKRQINKSALRSLLQVLSLIGERQGPSYEKGLLDIARRLTVRELNEQLKKLKAYLQGDTSVFPQLLTDEALPGKDGVDTVPATVPADLEEEKKGRWISARLPVQLAALWDFTLEWVRRMEESEIPESQCVEMILADYCASIPAGFDAMPQGAGEGTASSQVGGDDGGGAIDSGQNKSSGDSESGRISRGQLENDLAAISHYWSFLPWNPLKVEVPDELTPDSAWFSSPHLMVEKLKEMRSLRKILTFHQGRLLARMQNMQLQQELMFLSTTHYGRERLGMSANTIRTRIRMARDFHHFPALEEEYLKERLGQEKVKLLGQVIGAGTSMGQEWIEYGRVVPVTQLAHSVKQFLRLKELESSECYDISPWKLHRMPNVVGAHCNVPLQLDDGSWETENRAQMCELDDGIRSPELGIREERREECPGRSPSCEIRTPNTKCLLPPEAELKGKTITIRFYLPADLQETWDLAYNFYEAQSIEQEKTPNLTGFIEVLLTDFLAAWGPAKAGLSKRQKTLERDGYTCQIPGCTCRRSLEVHHIVYKSRGGSDHQQNRLTVCGFHHKKCVHQGYLLIEGTSNNRLYIFGNSGDTPSWCESHQSPLAVFENDVRILSYTPTSGLTTARAPGST